MAPLSVIKHENDLLRKKVSFFSDYFNFASHSIGQNDNIPADNPLSLTEKILIQLKEKLNNNAQYISNYITSPWLHEDNILLNKMESFTKVRPLIIDYKSTPDNKRNKWLLDNPDFEVSINELRIELASKMSQICIEAIASYLKCPHDIEHHHANLIMFSNCIVSEFILDRRSKKDLKFLLDKVFSDEPNEFSGVDPIEIKTGEEKYEDNNNRTFDDQFKGIYNALVGKAKEYYFIFRVYNMSVKSDFEFTYNKVTFFSPENEKLNKLRLSLQENGFSEFINKDVGMLASVKAEFHSLEIASMSAIETINTELKFLNIRLGINCQIEPFTFILSETHEKMDGYRGNHYEHGLEAGDIELTKLNDNPFVVLKDYSKTSTTPFLQAESLFSIALETKSANSYWHYFETLLGSKTEYVIDTISNILTLNGEYHYKEKVLRPYINNAIIQSGRRLLGLQQDQVKKFYAFDADFTELSSVIKHDFMSHLLSEYLHKYSASDLERYKEHYRRILIDTKSERNFYLHRGIKNEKAAILIKETLPRMITRFRWLIFEGIKKYNGKPFLEIINLMNSDAENNIRSMQQY